jgi:RNA polymerase sigma-70 factor, ECF subfamily
VGIFSLIASARSRHQQEQVPSHVSPAPAPSICELDPRCDRLRSAAPEERDQAWRILYRDEFARVYRLACRFGVPGSEVEDVVQQVFLIAYRHIADQQEVLSVRAWLRGIAVKVIADRRRWERIRRLKAWVVDSIYGDEARATAPTPAMAAENAEVVDEVAAVLRSLRPKLRTVLVLCDIEECSLAEVADAVGAPINTVRSRRRLAREAFQREWERRRTSMKARP